MSHVRAVVNTGQLAAVGLAAFAFGAAVTIGGVMLADAVIRTARRVIEEAAS